MLKLINECAPWLNWKIAAVFAVAVVCIGLIVGANVGLLALVGATPLLAIAACLVPCLIPLVLLRDKKAPAQNTRPATDGCSCGSDACSTGADASSCQSQVITIAEKRV